MSKIFLNLIVVFFFGFCWVSNSYAQTLEISSNSANSLQTIILESGSVVQVVQTNKSEIKNIINASSSTGDNSLDSSNGGSITTGNSTTKVQINNLLNQNIDTNSCCNDPKSPTPTPSTIPTKNPYPSSTPTTGPSISVVGGSNDSSSSISDPAIGGAPVLGLSNTSSFDTVQLAENISTSLAVLCLVASVFVLKSTFRS